MNVTYPRIPKKYVALWLLLIFLTGPLLPIAYGIKRWANASRFDRPDRWASVRAFALMFTLPYVALGLLLLLPPLAEQKSLVVLWIQQHFFFDTRSLWSWSLARGIFLFTWMSTQPLAFWFALALQDLDRENALQYTRVVLPGEIPPPQSSAMQPVAVIPAPVLLSADQQPKRRRTTSTRKKEKPVPPTVKLPPPAEPAAQAATSTAEHSLWDQTDWNNVSDDDPVKQLALEEDRQRKSVPSRLVEPPSEASPAVPPQAPVPQESPADAPAQKKRIDWSKVDE